jgi:hypothetical protein
MLDTEETLYEFLAEGIAPTTIFVDSWNMRRATGGVDSALFQGDAINCVFKLP